MRGDRTWKKEKKSLKIKDGINLADRTLTTWTMNLAFPQKKNLFKNIPAWEKNTPQKNKKQKKPKKKVYCKFCKTAVKNILV